MSGDSQILLVEDMRSNKFAGMAKDISMAMEYAMVSDLRGHTYCCGSKRGPLLVVVLLIRQVAVYRRSLNSQLRCVRASVGWSILFLR